MIPLEDNFADVLSKAQRGLQISDAQLAEKARVDPGEIRKLRGGRYDEFTLFRVAPVLALGARALDELAQGKYQPATSTIPGLAMFNTKYHDITVNAYAVWDPATRDAVVFDTGAECGSILERIAKEKLEVRLILLTHAHPDHIADLKKLRESTHAPIFISSRESAPGAEPIEEGREFNVGSLHIKALLTWGHSAGGMTYFVTGLSRPVAVVGDSMFAGSMGGGNTSYKDALQNNLEKILTLPNDTIVCPGHGPLTSVADEKEHNPFFAGR